MLKDMNIARKCIPVFEQGSTLTANGSPLARDK